MFVSWFEDNHISKNYGWRDYLWMGGIATHQNTQESSNRHSLRKSLQQALSELFPEAKLPVSLFPAIRVIFETIIPGWSFANAT